ncbi:hypothetical protein PR202_gb13156 [Eleusine coracana subsp. coracana]|uniref:Uncharacterized protein n=1 Tax=Eleusine coracana subsp. coracana TaxID=191504 RepID=A0AAV5ERR0_ELECO|nr:hypothetical protein PR202_gb13156 [Eleusine coracana subsp. coracana]
MRLSTMEPRLASSSTVRPTRPGRRPKMASWRRSVVSRSRISRWALCSCSLSLSMRCLRKPSMSIIFLHWSSSGIALNRASTRAASATEGHTSGWDSPSP